MRRRSPSAHRHLRLTGLTVMVLALAATLSQTVNPGLAGGSCETSWKDPVSGDWFDANRWTNGFPQQFSAANDDACITIAGTYTVSMTTPSNAELNSLTIGGSSGAQTLTVFRDLAVYSNVSVRQNGVVIVTDNGAVSNGVFRPTTMTIDAGAELRFVYTPATHQARMSVNNLLNNGLVKAIGTHPSQCPPILDTGANAVFTNNGTVQVDHCLSMSMQNGAMHNNGTILVNPGGAFGMGRDFFPPSFNQNSGGTITNNGSFGFSTGGAFTWNGGAHSGNPIQIKNSSLNLPGSGAASFVLFGDTQNSPTLVSDVPADKTLTIVSGGSFMAGTPYAQAPSRVDLVFTGATRTNFGTMRFTVAQAGAFHRLLSSADANLFINQGTMEVFETAGVPDGVNFFTHFDNRGALNVNHHLTVTRVNPLFTNSGAVNVAAGKSLQSFGQGVHAHASYTQTAGSTNLSPGAILEVDNQGGVNLQGGALTGAGTVRRVNTVAGLLPLVNSGGEVRPGASPGKLRMEADYTQTAGGRLAIEVNGATPVAGYDVLEITGAATLSGTLTVSTTGFTPTAGQQFPIMTFASRGLTEFFSVTFGAGPVYQLVYNSTNVTLQAPSSDLRVTQITPNRGGDIGAVTVVIHGDGFQAGAVVNLVRPGHLDIPGAGAQTGNAGSTLTATFDLRGRAHGTWTVVVTNPSGSTVALPNGFIVELGRTPQVSVQVLGPTTLRPGSQGSYYVLFANRGNVDAIGLPGVRISPGDVEIVEIDGPPPPPPFASWGTVPAPVAPSEGVQVRTGDSVGLLLPNAVLPPGAPPLVVSLRLRSSSPTVELFQIEGAWSAP